MKTLLKLLLCKIIGHDWREWSEKVWLEYLYFPGQYRWETDDYRECKRCGVKQKLYWEGFGEIYWR